MKHKNKPSLREKINELRQRDLVNILHHFYEHRGETGLWRSVILQALLDATSQSCKIDERRHKARAISWLSGTCEDFALVCDLADFNKEFVIKKATEALSRSFEWKKKPNINARRSGNKFTTKNPIIEDADDCALKNSDTLKKFGY